jgi:hypothetical protein
VKAQALPKAYVQQNSNYAGAEIQAPEMGFTLAVLIAAVCLHPHAHY